MGQLDDFTAMIARCGSAARPSCNWRGRAAIGSRRTAHLRSHSHDAAGRAGWISAQGPGGGISVRCARYKPDALRGISWPKSYSEENRHDAEANQIAAESPREVGLDPYKVEELFNRAEREVAEGLLPSTQIAIARNGKIGAMRSSATRCRAARTSPPEMTRSTASSHAPRRSCRRRCGF